MQAENVGGSPEPEAFDDPEPFASLFVPTCATSAPDEPPQPAATSVRPPRAAPTTTITAARALSLRPCLTRGWGRRLDGYASTSTEAICRERSHEPGCKRVTAGVAERCRRGRTLIAATDPAVKASPSRLLRRGRGDGSARDQLLAGLLGGYELGRVRIDTCLRADHESAVRLRVRELGHSARAHALGVLQQCLLGLRLLGRGRPAAVRLELLARLRGGPALLRVGIDPGQLVLVRAPVDQYLPVAVRVGEVPDPAIAHADRVRSRTPGARSVRGRQNVRAGRWRLRHL